MSVLLPTRRAPSMRSAVRPFFAFHLDRFARNRYDSARYKTQLSSRASEPLLRPRPPTAPAAFQRVPDRPRAAPPQHATHAPTDGNVKSREQNRPRGHSPPLLLPAGSTNLSTHRLRTAFQATPRLRLRKPSCPLRARASVPSAFSPEIRLRVPPPAPHKTPGSDTRRI